MASSKLAQLRRDAKAAGWDRYIVTENDERAVLEGCTVDESRGIRVVNFVEKYLMVPGAEGQQSKPLILSEFQKSKMIMPLFSWVRPDGRRRFTTADWWVCKKIGKTTLAGALSIYFVKADGEPSPQVYSAAVDRSQSGHVYIAAASIIRASPALRNRIKCIDSQKRFVVLGAGGLPEVGSFFRALSAEFRNVEGINPHVRIVDEIHVFDSRGRALFESLRYASAARRQPLGLTLSTAGEEETGVGYEQYSYSKAVLNGEQRDTSHFPVIMEAARDDDWTDPKVWRKANPHIGVTIDEDEVRRECEKAQQNPQLINTFKRYRLNIWCNADAGLRLDGEKWRECYDPDLTLDDLDGLPCCGGLDLSSTTDLTAFVLLFRHQDDPPAYTLWPFFWLPEENIRAREDQDRAHYRLWAEQGLIDLTPGARIEYSAIEEKIVWAHQRFSVHEIGFDLYNAEMVRQRVEALHGIKMVPVPQTCSGMNAGSKELIALCETGRLRHNGNIIMSRMVEAARFHSNGNGDYKPVKSDTAKKRKRIDGVTAAVNAMTRALLMPQYSDDSGGLVVL